MAAAIRAATSPDLGTAGGAIVQISATGIVAPYASFSGNTPTCLAVNPAGNLYANIGPFDSTQIVQVAAGGTDTVLAAVNGSCAGMAFDASGTLYVSYELVQTQLTFISGIAAVSTDGNVAYLNANAGGEGIAAETVGDVVRLIVPNQAGDGLDYVTPSLAPLPPPHYSYTQADERDIAIYGSLSASLDFLKFPPPEGGEAVTVCPNFVTKLAPGYSACASAFPFIEKSITAIPQYFTNKLGLDFAGALPPSKTPLMAENGLARFAIATSGLEFGLVYTP